MELIAGLLPTPEQGELRGLIRSIVTDHVDGRRDAIAAGADTSAWRALVDDVGVGGLAVPEEHGGSGMGWAEVSVAFEETGAGLLPVPVLPTSLAVAALLQAAGSGSEDDLLRQVAAGTRRAVPVLALGPDATCLAGAEDGRIELRRASIIEPQDVDVLLVPVETADGALLYALDAAVASIEPTDTVDLTRPMALVTLDGVNAEPLGAVDVHWMHDLGRFLVAAEQVGGARACLDMAVTWAKERRQFDRPIGSFQSIKHQLADAFVNVEAASAALAEAARLVAAGGLEFAAAAAVAKSMAGDAFHDNAELSIHVHGGIGFTWEHDAHLYYRRALATNALFGHPRWLDRAVGAQLAAPR